MAPRRLLRIGLALLALALLGSTPAAAQTGPPRDPAAGAPAEPRVAAPDPAPPAAPPAPGAKSLPGLRASAPPVVQTVDEGLAREQGAFQLRDALRTVPGVRPR
jgi:hypothetical protein